MDDRSFSTSSAFQFSTPSLLEGSDHDSLLPPLAGPFDGGHFYGNEIGSFSPISTSSPQVSLVTSSQLSHPCSRSDVSPSPLQDQSVDLVRDGQTQTPFITPPTMHPNLVTTLKSILSPPRPPDSQLLAATSAGAETACGSFVADNAQENSDMDETLATVVPVDLIRNRRPFKCGFEGCNKTFKNPQTMKMHYKTHYPGTAACKLRMNSLSGSSQSLKTGHNKKIPSRCPLCRKTFVGLYELRRHFGRKHSEGEKTHSCKKCGKRFYIEVDLRDHEKLCGEPIHCKCGMKFAFKCNLVAHKKAHPECQDMHSPVEEQDHHKFHSSRELQTPATDHQLCDTGFQTLTTKEASCYSNISFKAGKPSATPCMGGDFLPE